MSAPNSSDQPSRGGGSDTLDRAAGQVFEDAVHVLGHGAFKRRYRELLAVGGVVLEHAEQLDALTGIDQRHDAVGGDQRLITADFQHGIAVFVISVDDVLHHAVYFK